MRVKRALGVYTGGKMLAAQDVTLLDFQVIQYRRKGDAVATGEQLERIARVPKRELMRRGINQHTGLERAIGLMRAISARSIPRRATYTSMMSATATISKVRQRL